MLTCPSAWTPAPADAAVPFSSACYKASGYAISLRECVERCALDGAAPVCPASAAENNFVSSVALFTGINYLWLGVYRNASGIDRCVTGVDSDYTSYSIQFGQPDNVYGLEHCTYQYSSNDASWYDSATDRLEAKVDRLQATLDRLMSEGIQSVAVARTTADDVLSA